VVTQVGVIQTPLTRLASAMPAPRYLAPRPNGRYRIRPTSRSGSLPNRWSGRVRLEPGDHLTVETVDQAAVAVDVPVDADLLRTCRDPLDDFRRDSLPAVVLGHDHLFTYRVGDEGPDRLVVGHVEARPDQPGVGNLARLIRTDVDRSPRKRRMTSSSSRAWTKVKHAPMRNQSNDGSSSNQA
jgi:hypothetical protein